MSEYRLLQNSYPPILEQDVQAHLRQGWLLCGVTYMINGMFYQALMK